ncbi:MAG: dTDP-4-dehydrorhamnose 3,5-epimerase [Gemmobacter sp.]|nr:dTDP-4-dehydrorhamnose 3,5-epimerase [Gemmobacter sp.]
MHATEFAGASLIEPKKLGDERGYFSRIFCAEEFLRHGLPATFVQQNVSVSKKRGTLRGMHYQIAPHAEAKLVRCIRGEIVDVIIDLRPQSPTFLKWAAFHLSAQNMLQLLVPAGFAHGFQTCTDDTEVGYLVTQAYCPAAERGVRWNDPLIGITWPLEPSEMSHKDRNWPDLDLKRVARRTIVHQSAGCAR